MLALRSRFARSATAIQARRCSSAGYEVRSYVAGEDVDGGTPVPKVSPATGQVIGHVHYAGESVLDQAVEAATVAQREWFALQAAGAPAHRPRC